MLILKGSNMAWLEKFIAESNKIEGINRAPYQREIDAHEMILRLDQIDIPHLQEFVSMIAPHHSLRSQPGMDVMVGDHLPEPGGPEVVVKLTTLLERINTDSVNPFILHKEYEFLHPFTNGNGRSGRAIWLWLMQKRHQLNEVMKRGFLHNWYYQSL